MAHLLFVINQLSSDFETVRPSSDATVLIYVEGRVTNQGKEETTGAGGVQLVDARGREFGDHEDAIRVAEPLVLDSFNPGVPKEFSTVFEVPADAAPGISLKATNFEIFGAEEQLIDLGLAAP